MGGAWSMWRQSGEQDEPPATGRPKPGAQAAQPRGRSVPHVVIAVILLIAALLATASGILRLI
nr:hypothetical protein [Petropleomorpha daqingensis]